jgi:ribosomal protein S27AE
MKCPHCLTAFHDNVERHNIGDDISSFWVLLKRVCPECGRYILSLNEHYERYHAGGRTGYDANREFLCYPKAPIRVPLPQEVPESYASDYREACLTLVDSAKASAALSRRCLQHLLREEAKVKHGNLADEIQHVLDAGKLPSHLLHSLDAVRNIGNFAAHPIKSKSSGEIIDVEPGEAEWNLDVLESLFDYFFVQPALLKKKRDALNLKLKEAGKPEMK